MRQDLGQLHRVRASRRLREDLESIVLYPPSLCCKLPVSPVLALFTDSTGLRQLRFDTVLKGSGSSSRV